MRKAVVVAIVGLVGLVLGVAVAGRPQSVPSDLGASDIASPSTSTTTIPRVTTPRVTTTSPRETSPTTEADTTTSTPPSTAPSTTTTLVPEQSVRVVVANATNVARRAARTVEVLRRFGYTNLIAADAVSDRPDTVIYYVDGRSGEALRLAAQLGIDARRVVPRPASDLTVTGEAGDLWLMIGQDLA